MHVLSGIVYITPPNNGLTGLAPLKEDSNYLLLRLPVALRI